MRPARVVVERAADMHFVGQTHLIRVPLPQGPVSIEALQARFEAAYHERFRVRLPEIHAAVASLRTAVIGERAPVDLSGLLPEADRAGTPEEALIDRRRAVFGGAALLTPVYDRTRLPRGAVVDGPAILRQSDTTVLVEPGDRAECGAEGVLLVALGAARAAAAA